MRALIVCVVMLATSVASADVVFPPPDTCPPGAIPATGHAGPYCRATECTSVADCVARSTPFVGACAPAGLCVREQLGFAGRGGRVPLRVTLGSCRSDADCSSGVACVRVDRCIAEGSVEGPVASSLVPRIAGTGTTGCGAMSVLALVVLAGAASIFVARRTDRVRRDEALRELVVSRGGARRAELGATDAEIARALAPIAQHVRVEIDDDGDVYYAIEDAEDIRARLRP